MEYEILKHETHYQGFFRMDSYQLRHELFKGGWSPEIRRELLERGNAVAVLLHDPNTDHIVILEQFRPGAIRDEQGPWMPEIVAGIIEKNENPEQVAIREAEEEAGCTINKLEHILDFYPSPGGCTEQISLYYAPLDLSAAKQGLFGLEEEGEDIRVSIVPRQTAMQWIKEGRIKSSFAIIALQWLALKLLHP